MSVGVVGVIGGVGSVVVVVSVVFEVGSGILFVAVIFHGDIVGIFIVVDATGEGCDGGLVKIHGAWCRGVVCHFSWLLLISLVWGRFGVVFLPVFLFWFFGGARR